MVKPDTTNPDTTNPDTKNPIVKPLDENKDKDKKDAAKKHAIKKLNAEIAATTDKNQRLSKIKEVKKLTLKDSRGTKIKHMNFINKGE